MNSKHKNIIIAVMAAGIFYTNVVQGIPKEKVIIAVVLMFIGAMAVMEVYDGIDELRYGTKRFLTKYRFKMYKLKVEKQVAINKAKGRDELWMRSFIMNYVMFDKRFAFSGAQLSELMKLAKDEQTAKCAKCGHEGIKKDILKTIDGYICENCIKE